MRGKGAPPCGARPILRITPACAGKSRSQPRLPCTGRDHPRACGEKQLVAVSPKQNLGSPPRMRGKVQIVAFPMMLRGITPAHAGKSPKGGSSGEASRDHPRACGEKQSRTAAVCAQVGSPPRMRGKAASVAPVPVGYGITPAHAGKRRAKTTQQLAAWDHPRACGEKFHQF